MLSNLLPEHIPDLGKIPSSCYKVQRAFPPLASLKLHVSLPTAGSGSVKPQKWKQKIGLGNQGREQICLRPTHLKIEICKQNLAAVEQGVQIAVGTGTIMRLEGMQGGRCIIFN